MKCDKCTCHVDIWTAYYWFHTLGAWLCLNCIYKKPKRTKGGAILDRREESSPSESGTPDERGG